MKKFLVMLTLFTCSSIALAKGEAGHWSYLGETGPEHWAELEPNSQCGGQNQSPINIITIDTNPTSSRDWPLQLKYLPTTKIHHVVNNGHSIQYDFAKGDEIVFKGKTFSLKQIHFHEPSEHTLNGLRYPIEMHLVHYNRELDEFAVLAVLGEEGRNSPPFSFLEKFLPLVPGERKVIDQAFNLESALPAVLTPRFHYRGSLTTPPCTENVNWIVFQKPITLSHEQVIELKKLMPLNNYRDTQPLRKRSVVHVVH